MELLAPAPARSDAVRSLDVTCGLELSGDSESDAGDPAPKGYSPASRRRASAGLSGLLVAPSPTAGAPH